MAATLRILHAAGARIDKTVSYTGAPPPQVSKAEAQRPLARRETFGIDVYIGWRNPDTDALAAKLAPLAPAGLKLTMLTSRGIKVWPDGAPETFRVDECRWDKANEKELIH